MKTETLGSLLAAARKSFSEAGIETAPLDARLLLLAATSFSHEDLIAMPDMQAAPQAIAAFQAMVARRLAHEPVSRILGTREFYGRSFMVTPAVLDPRPDTEVVVALALKHLKQGRFIDLGTGSGAIAVTLCAENQQLQGLATDLSPDALKVARENAEALGVGGRLQFQQSSWFDDVEGRFDLIISNPPYIRAQEALPADVRNFDPHLALFGGEDGLAAYRAIAADAQAHLTEGGEVILEIGHDQADDVIAIFRDCDFMLLDRSADLGARDRALAFANLKPDKK